MENTEREKWIESAMIRWESSLLRTCYAYLGDLSLAEDALQETFLKAWKHFDGFRGDANEKTWLMRIAINTCKDIRRSAWFRHTDSSAALDSLPEGSVPFTARDDSLVLAIMKLKPKLKEVVLLRWYQQLSGDETAQVLGISRSTVYTRLEKARRQLQRELEDWYHAE